MWGVVVLFVVLVVVVSFIALCYRTRRQNRQRLYGATAPFSIPAGLPRALTDGIAPGHRLGIVAAESPSGRHVIVVSVPATGTYAEMSAAAASLAAAARAQQLLPNGKLPTPAAVIANLPTYKYTLRDGCCGSARGGPREGMGGSADAAARDEELMECKPDPNKHQPSGSASSLDDGESGTHGQTCVICCSDFTPGTTVKVLPCLHSFCADCIDAWLARDTHCPVCRENVLRAAGISDADALGMVVSAAAGIDPLTRRRQIDGNEAGAAAAAAWVVSHQGRVMRLGAPDLQVQAQQQRLWQLGGHQPVVSPAVQPQQPQQP